MRSFRFALTAVFIAAFGIHSASALEVQDSSSNAASFNLTDPEDKMPVAHIADDGSFQPAPGLQLQTSGGNQPSFGFGLTPGGGDQGQDAFSRAQERFQQ